MRLAANISLLFTEAPLEDRPALAAEAGFEGIEILFPYDSDAQALKRACAAAEMPVVLINHPPPNYTGGPRGFAAVPGAAARFASDLRRSQCYAGTLGARHLHLMAGVAEGEAAFDCFVVNLRAAAEDAPEASFTIEPLSPGTAPGYFLNDFGLAARVLDAVDRPNVGLQFDTFHAAAITGDVAGTFRAHRGRIAHIQVGGFPGRGIPGPELAPFWEALAASGYDGWVSAEYDPGGPTDASLGWRLA